MATSTEEDVDLSVFTELMEGLDLKPKCEADGCDSDAEIIIFCPICKIKDVNNGEFSCVPCYTAMVFTNSFIIFNKFCNHAAPIEVCPTSPV